MSIFQRLKMLFSGVANSAVDSLENPEIVLNETIRELERGYGGARDAVASSMAEQKRLENLASKAKEDRDMWEERANKALDSGDEELAGEAALRMEEAEQSMKNYEDQAEFQKDQVAVLRDQLKSLEESIKEAKTTKENLLAKHKTAQVNGTVAKVFDNIGKGNYVNTINRMEEKINNKYNKAQAKIELNTDPLDQKFKELDKPNVQAALARLKSKRTKRQEIERNVTEDNNKDNETE